MQAQKKLPRGIAASLTKALDNHFLACAAAATAAMVVGQVQNAQATIVYSGIQNVPLTNGSPGIYIDLVTNASSASPFAGWDVNPYVNSGSTGTFFAQYMPSTTLLVKSSSPTAGGADVAMLPAGASIGPASTLVGNHFGFMNNDTAGDWKGTGKGYMGIQFIESGVNGGNPVYGWMQISKTIAGDPPRGGPTGITFIDWAYDDSGAAINAGDTGVPEPSSLALLAVGAIGLCVRRGKVKLRQADTSAA